MTNFFNTKRVNFIFQSRRRKIIDLTLERITNNLLFLPRRLKK